MGPCAWQIKSVSGDRGAVTQSATPGLSHGASRVCTSQTGEPPLAWGSSSSLQQAVSGPVPWHWALGGGSEWDGSRGLFGRAERQDHAGGERAEGKGNGNGPAGRSWALHGEGPEASSGRPTSLGHTAPCGPSGGPWSTEALNVPSGREAGAAASSRSAWRHAFPRPLLSARTTFKVLSRGPARLA